MVLTISDFPIGSLHSVTRVASFFGLTPMTIRRWIKIGQLNAVRPEGSTLILVPGEAVRERYRAMGLDPDVQCEPLPATPAEERKRANAAMKRLAKLGTK